MFKILVIIGLISALVIESQCAPNPQSNQMAMNWAQSAVDSSKRVGQPQFHVQGGGSGNNGRNWGAGGNLGLSMKVFESKNRRHTLGAGVNVDGAFGRHNGQRWHAPVNKGVGASYRFRF